jgi:predicted acylesterase/phospholipase RssA
MSLIDGGVTNNCPLAIATGKFPRHKIIGISLNKYQKNQKIKNIFDNLLVSFEIMLRKDIEPQ